MTKERLLNISMFIAAFIIQVVPDLEPYREYMVPTLLAVGTLLYFGLETFLLDAVEIFFDSFYDVIDEEVEAFIERQIGIDVELDLTVEQKEYLKDLVANIILKILEKTE
jgi:hypothetical protein